MLNMQPYQQGYFGLGDIYPEYEYASTQALTNPEAAEVVLYESMNRQETETMKNAQAEAITQSAGAKSASLTMKHVLIWFVVLILLVSVLHL